MGIVLYDIQTNSGLDFRPDLSYRKLLMPSIKCTGGLRRGRDFEENFRNL